MRGFAIPRRWLISLALVGLVSLFAATLTSSWSDPSRASAATGTDNSTILGGIALLLIETVLIAALIWELRMRQRAEAVARESEQAACE